MASKKPPVKAKRASTAKPRGKSGKSATKPASAAKSQRAHVSKSSAARGKSPAAKTKAASARKKASVSARSAVKKSAAEKAAARKLAAQKAAAKKAAAARSAASKAAAARSSAASKAAAKKAAAAKASSGKAAAAAKAKATAAKSQAASVATGSRVKAAVARTVEARTAPVLKAPSAAGSAAVKAQPAGAKIPPISNGIVAASPGAAVEVARKAKAPTAPAPSAPLRAGPDQKRPIASESPRASMNLSQTPAATAVKPASPVVSGALAAAAPKPIVAPKPRPSSQKLGFKLSEHIVYPAHGVGQIVGIEVQEVAGFSLELFVVSFVKDKMTLKVPTSKVAAVGMRKLSEGETVEKALTTLSGRARIKRTMWSRRAQEYEAKINSGDLVTIAEVVRDLYRSDTQPEQSYSERQLYEAALDRMSREISAVRKLIDSESLKVIESYLAKGPRRGAKNEPDSADSAGEDADVERAA